MATVVGIKALKRRLDAIGDTKSSLRALQVVTISEAKARVPRKTGHLAGSIVAGRVTDDYAVVNARTPYAAAVEFGSKAHEIVPKRARALAWPASPAGRRLSGRRRTNSGRLIFATKVDHPGTKAQPYLIPGAKAAISKAGGFKDAIIARWNGAA
jgi:hypothetical protein